MISNLLSWTVQALFFLIVLYFAAYVLLELRVVLISRKVERRQQAALQPIAEIAGFAQSDTASMPFPLVSVLLPVCNEAAVVRRLIDAACELDYPAHALEILVLDDSSDHTSAIAQASVEHYAARAVDIRLVRRAERRDHKAGNLIHGISQSRGEFFAVFDADFVPPRDFLLKTVPRFKDPKLGFLQTGIGFQNGETSFLTRFQAMEMGHQQYVTVGLSEEGGMASLSGSSCVWRRACVEALGGWTGATVTEDVDLGYRAQLGDWKYAYLPDVVSMSLLPDSVSAFRVQRERWGRGLIHNAFKHLREMFRQPMPLLRRLHAVSMMCSSVLLASIYVLVLLSLPLNYVLELDHEVVVWTAPLFFVLVTVWALNNSFGSRRAARVREASGLVRSLWHTYLYVAMFLPMAWYYFAGGMRALLGVRGEFHRTPKGGEGGKDAHCSRMSSVNRTLWLGEVFTFLYSAVTMVVAVGEGHYVLLPLNATVCTGFGMVLFWSWQERRRAWA